MNDKNLPNVIEADYLAEARTPEQLPPPGPLEIVIAGRSNVGKSTLLNRLTSRKALARTSKTPGRTRGIIFYDVSVKLPPEGAPRTGLRFVDVPGYGYAQVSQTERQSWQTLIETYVEQRPTLALFLVLVDARRALETEEVQLIEWLDSLGTPKQVVITKVDKLSASERGAVRERFRAQLPPHVAVSFVSGQTGEGVDRVWGSITYAVKQAAAAGSPDGPG